MGAAFFGADLGVRGRLEKKAASDCAIFTRPASAYMGAGRVGRQP